jgi:hypothetical protein
MNEDQDWMQYLPRAIESLDWIANAINHPDHPETSLSIEVDRMAEGLFAIANALNRIADSMSCHQGKKVSDA